MAFEITNQLRSPSIIRVEGASTVNVNISQLSTNTALETVVSANIKRIAWSTGGSIVIGRHGASNTLITLATLFNSGQMNFDELGTSLANTNTGNVTVTITTSGTVILEVSKNTTYSTDLDRT